MRRARRRISQTFEFLSLAFALLLVLLITLFAYRTWSAFGRSSEHEASTRQMVKATNSLLSSLKDAESGQRGFLLTGEDRYLNPYRQAVSDIPATLSDLDRSESTAGSDQVQRFNRLKPLVKTKMHELARTIEVRLNQGPEAALDIVRMDQGETVMNQIREICSEIQAVSRDLLAKETADTRAKANETGLIGVLGSATVFLFLVLSTIAVQRGTRRRQHLIEALEQSENKTTEARDWLQAILLSIGDAVIATDETGRVQFLNGVAEALTGWTQESAREQPLDQIFIIHNEETGAPVENPVRRALRESKLQGLANHTQLTSKDGRQIPIDDSAAPIQNAAGQVTGVVLVFRDVTDRKKAERATQTVVDNLRRANEDLNQFAFAASHDLQEPLRMITSYSQLLVKRHSEQLDSDSALWMKFITDGTRRMRDLLADLLAYTQVADTGELSIECVDLNLVFRKTIENLKVSIEESRAVVTSEELPIVSGYEPHFLQLFQNLISNAIKYRGEQAPQIRIVARRQGKSYNLAVIDNGIGIDPEHHQKIFGVFRRLHGKSIPGTGIGLAICQRVVERYGGRIWVESQAGQGAAFHFTLPVSSK